MQLPPTPEDECVLSMPSSAPQRAQAHVPQWPAPVDLVCGPMFSGKTSALDGLADAAEHAGRSVFIVSPASAERYGAQVVSTHSQRQRPCVSIARLSTIATVRGTHFWHLVLVEEAHFFELADLRDFVERVRWCCARLAVFGLDGTWQLHAFPWLGELAPLARSIQKLNGMCRRCESGVAVCTLRREGVEGGELLVGADQEYEAVCAACHPRCAAKSPGTKYAQSYDQMVHAIKSVQFYTRI
jgi:thymidine kinase